MIGDFKSPESQGTDVYESQRSNFDHLGSIIRKYELLRDHTQWILMPSSTDTGIMQVLPSFKLSDFFIDAFRGKTQRIKKVVAASNPMKISFRGKEMVFCRYNYFRKIKKNHIEKLQLQQEKQEEEQKKS